MVDKLRVVHPTPGMLVLRRVDDALFIHRFGDCPGYSLLANAFVSGGRRMAAFLPRKNGDSFWPSAVRTCYVNVYFASLTILIIEASTSLAISLKVVSPDKALSISIGLI
jgi:hypothetical protein